MKDFKSIIVLFCLLGIFTILTQANKSECHPECIQSTGCSNDKTCTNQIKECDKQCLEMQDEEDSTPLEIFKCRTNCIKMKYGSNINQKTKEVLKCEDNCLKGQTPKAPRQNSESSNNKDKNDQNLTFQQKLANIKQNLEVDIYSHPGTTFEDIDCEKFKNSKQRIMILLGNTHSMIVKYFQSRCDFEIDQKPKGYNLNNIKWWNYQFIYTDYNFQQDYSTFKEGKQITNHFKNFKPLLSDKDGIVRTLLAYDKQRVYNFDSTSFHAETYVFDLDTPEYDERETYFMQKVHDGFWLAKDPDGSLGIGIVLFRGVEEIKKNIKILKATPGVKLKKKNSKQMMFACIQRYIEKPLLIKLKKHDVRSYVLIPSVKPFVILYQTGFIRQCIETYDLNFQQFDYTQAFKHLTNRLFQKQHPLYEQETENLMWTPITYENHLQNELGFSEEKIRNMWINGQKTVAYAILSAYENLEQKIGVFQLLGVDIMFDESLNAWLIEFNTSAGLFVELPPHRYVVPQLVQTSYDIVLKSHEDPSKLNEIWKNPSQHLDLGRWEILYNEASGYSILDEHLNIQKKDEF